MRLALGTSARAAAAVRHAMQRRPLPGACHALGSINVGTCSWRARGVTLPSSVGGIAPCVIDRSLPLPHPGRLKIRFTDADAKWLKACGIA